MLFFAHSLLTVWFLSVYVSLGSLVFWRRDAALSVPGTRGLVYGQLHVPPVHTCSLLRGHDDDCASQCPLPAPLSPSRPADRRPSTPTCDARWMFPAAGRRPAQVKSAEKPARSSSRSQLPTRVCVALLPSSASSSSSSSQSWRGPAAAATTTTSDVWAASSITSKLFWLPVEWLFGYNCDVFSR